MQTIQRVDRCYVVVVALWVVSASSLFAGAAEFKPTAQSSIVPADAQLEIVYNDGDFTEGPAAAPDGTILFSDIGDRILRFDPATGKTDVYRQPSGRANGLVFSPKGELVACEGANTGGRRRISITGVDGKVRTLADRYQGKRFNSPNDLALDPQGRVYFTDPRYVGEEPRDLDFEAVFLVEPDGKVRIATNDVQKPNGILVAPDGRHVYLADNNAQGNRHLAVFTVADDGTLKEKRILHDFGEGRGIDGMTLDASGNLYATAGSGENAGVYVFSPEGKLLAQIPTPGDPTNCTFARGKAANMLYITAEGPPPKSADAKRRYALYRIRLKTNGPRGERENHSSPP
jgi:gluconolactonase